MRQNYFYRQAHFLLRILPYFADQKEFAIKGGTAINFFVRALPRLSVDIDLTFLPITNRDDAIIRISFLLQKVASRIRNDFPEIGMDFRYLPHGTEVIGIIFRSKDAVVKVEPNLVVRGTVFSTEIAELHPKAQEIFEQFLEAQILSVGDLYGGKICAALDRQHPRDLFDIFILFQNEGLRSDIRKAFLVYLISHNRPMIELLNPNRLPLETVFRNEFVGMTSVPVSLETLIEVRERLIEKIREGLTQKERKFLVSFKMREPEWDLLGIENVNKLPAVKWKLANLAKMDRLKHKKAVEKLRNYLDV